MKCPVDGEALVMADRSGVEIDYCPKCRGVWLDRGELDKIIERSAPAAPVETRRRDRDDNDDDDHRRGGPWGGDRDHGRRPHKRRESFLSELFDF